MTNAVQFKGADELLLALRRNPEKVRSEAGNYLQRGKALLLRKMMESPWRIGSASGGIPRDQGQLRQAHRSQVSMSSLTAIIYPDSQAAPYAYWVHKGTTRMEGRPWMDYAVKAESDAIMELQDQLLTNIVKDLAK